MIEKLYKHFTSTPSISTDTRKIQKGDIYFALKGANFNGNLFAEDAINKGASYAVIDEGEPLDKRYILVDNVLSFMQQFANHHRKQLNIPVLVLQGPMVKLPVKNY